MSARHLRTLHPSSSLPQNWGWEGEEELGWGGVGGWRERGIIQVISVRCSVFGEGEGEGGASSKCSHCRHNVSFWPYLTLNNLMELKTVQIQKEYITISTHARTHTRTHAHTHTHTHARTHTYTHTHTHTHTHTQTHTQARNNVH